RGEADQHQRAARQTERDDATQHGCPGSLLRLVVHEDRTTHEHEITGLEAVTYLHPALLLEPELHLAALEHHGLLFDPHDREIAFAKHRLERHPWRGLVDPGGDLEAREHLRLERTVGVRHLRAHYDATRREVGRGADGRNACPEHATRQGADLDLHLLAEAYERDLVLGYLRLDPHGGEVGDRVERLARIVAHVLARSDLARD